MDNFWLMDMNWKIHPVPEITRLYDIRAFQIQRQTILERWKVWKEKGESIPENAIAMLHIGIQPDSPELRSKIVGQPKKNQKSASKLAITSERVMFMLLP